MRVDHSNRKAAPDPVPGTPSAAAVNSRVMLTSIELLDRVAEIECATTLKNQRRRVPTEFDGVGVGLAYWGRHLRPVRQLAHPLRRVAGALDSRVDATRTPTAIQLAHAPMGALQRPPPPPRSAIQTHAPQFGAQRFVVHRRIDPQRPELFLAPARKIFRREFVRAFIAHLMTLNGQRSLHRPRAGELLFGELHTVNLTDFFC